MSYPAGDLSDRWGRKRLFAAALMIFVVAYVGFAATGSLRREFLLGFIKIHILHHAAQEAVYGLALIRELQRHGYELSPGTLYPILHRLETAGYLTREERLVSGKRRKYYMPTPEGYQALNRLRQPIRELLEEVVEGRWPQQLD